MIIAVILIIIASIGYLSTHVSRKFALKYNITDDPNADISRKKHKSPIPLMGATGFVFTALVACASLWLFAKYNIDNYQEYLYQGLYQRVAFFWVIVSVLLLMIAGYLDDAKKIGIAGRFGLTGLAILITIFLGGLKIEVLSYPFDALLPSFPLLPQALAFLWIGFCLFTTKVLDGHDGLVASVGTAGFLTIASVATLSNVNQPMIVLLSLFWAASLIGFLPYNYPNAKLYLGDGGSMIIGFMIGVLSILSGAKIATAGSVIGWFVIDLLFVWLRRIIDRRNPLTSSDRFHWHQRLSDSGLNKFQVLAITMIAVLTTARIGLMVQTQNKLYVLIAQGVILLAIFVVTFSLTRILVKTETNTQD